MTNEQLKKAFVERKTHFLSFLSYHEADDIDLPQKIFSLGIKKSYK